MFNQDLEWETQLKVGEMICMIIFVVWGSTHLRMREPLLFVLNKMATVNLGVLVTRSIISSMFNI